MITEQQKVDLQWLWLNGWPVSAAAEHLNIAETSASRIIATAKVKLARDGRSWPRPRPTRPDHPFTLGGVGSSLL